MPPGSPNPDPISAQNMSAFSTPVFRPGLVVTKRNITYKTEIMSSLERLKRQQKYFLKSISNSHITLSFPSFGIETTNTLIHNRSSFVNHTRFQTKLGQNLYPFSEQNGAKTLPFRAAQTYIIWLFCGCTPPPPPLIRA